MLSVYCCVNFECMILVFSTTVRLEDAYLYMDKSQSLLPEGSTNNLLSTTLQDNTSFLPSSSQHVWDRVLALGSCNIKVMFRVAIVALVVKLNLARVGVDNPWAQAHGLAHGLPYGQVSQIGLTRLSIDCLLLII